MQRDVHAPVVGCDVQAIDEVAAAVARFGDRYLDRVYTRAEQAQSFPAGSLAAGSLAARFAAKEAVLKLIGRPDGLDLRSVEVLRGPAGRPFVQLHGSAAHAQASAGIGRIDISLSHTAGLAFAVAAAICHPPASTTTPHHIPDRTDESNDRWTT